MPMPMPDAASGDGPPAANGVGIGLAIGLEISKPESLELELESSTKPPPVNPPCEKMPSPDSFAREMAVKLLLPDIGATPEGKGTRATLMTLYRRHVLPGHLGPPGEGLRRCRNEAMRIREDKTRKNRAGTFIGCMIQHLKDAGHQWEVE